MSQQINSNSIIISTSAEKVWFALTNSSEVNKYLPSIKVVSGWELGSSIVYTYYDKAGKIYQWNGVPMVWTGVIKTLKTNQTLATDYTDQSQGVISESYTLERLEKNSTKVTFTQTLVSPEMAENYKDGSQHTLNALKKYLEK